MNVPIWKRLKPEARRMRRTPTLSEDLLWQKLRQRSLAGAKFRRQHLIDPFIVDFYCAGAKVVVEVDGGFHRGTRAEDEQRQQNLERRGLRVLRFTAEEVICGVDSVMGAIRRVVLSRLEGARDALSSLRG